MPIKDKQRRREYNRAYRLRNLQRIRKQQMEYYTQNKNQRQAAHKKFYASNRDKYRRKAIENYNKTTGAILFRAAKSRAKRFGIKFDLSLSDVVVPECCPVFGLVLSKGVGYSHDASPTLDRLDATKGYVKDNVAVISRLANSLKGKATAAEHKRIAEWMESL